MDINCDLGEGMPDEEKLMAFIDSCNIACGGHYGDKASMTSSLKLAQKVGVTQSAVSQHLRVLRQVRLIRGERNGSFVHYSLNQERIEQFKDQLRETLGKSFVVIE